MELNWWVYSHRDVSCVTKKVSQSIFPFLPEKRETKWKCIVFYLTYCGFLHRLDLCVHCGLLRHVTSLVNDYCYGLSRVKNVRQLLVLIRKKIICDPEFEWEVARFVAGSLISPSLLLRLQHKLNSTVSRNSRSSTRHPQQRTSIRSTWKRLHFIGSFQQWNN